MNPLLLKGLTIRIRIIIPMKGRGFINQGSGLGYYNKETPLLVKGLGLGFRVWRTPHLAVVAIGDNQDYIKVLSYSYYTTITGWGVLLNNRLLQ